MNIKTAYRGSIFYFKDTATFENLPRKTEDLLATNKQFVYIEDGLLIIEGGKVVAVGEYADLSKTIDNISIVDYKNKLITPGFIDTHQHATQSGIVAAYGEKLLEWLDDYVFPGESIYKDDDVAIKESNFFLDLLLKNGTTTAVSYGPLFYNATEIFFQELKKRNMRFITGNILMDMNAPDYLRLTTEENYDNTIKLMEKWHNNGRLSYCISPRFALACSENMLQLCGALKKKNPDVYMQTHLDENRNEVIEIKKLYPLSKNYLDVYQHFGVVSDKTVFGHCVHTTDEELQLFRESNAIISWCPLSNNFLGSGLFNPEKTFEYTTNVTLGTDWGGGNSLSMFAVMDEAYKVSMLNSYKLPTMLSWYFATLGAARALKLDEKIGNFEIGKEADFIVIDLEASDYMKYRLERINNFYELLFILKTLGDQQNIAATYICGEPAYVRGKQKQ